MSLLVRTPAEPPHSCRKLEIDFLPVISVFPVLYSKTICSIVVMSSCRLYITIDLQRSDKSHLYIFCRSRGPVYSLHVSYRHCEQKHSIKSYCIVFIHILFFLGLIEASLVLARRRTPRRLSSISLTWPPPTRPRKIRSVLPPIYTDPAFKRFHNLTSLLVFF